MEVKKTKGVKKGSIKTQPHAIEYRINEIFKAMLAGAVLDAYKLREISIAQKWSVSDRQLCNYRKKALGKYADLAKIDRESEIGKAIARLQFLYNQCVVNKQFKVALGVQAELNKLLGLNASAKIVVDVNPFLGLMMAATAEEE